ALDARAFRTDDIVDIHCCDLHIRRGAGFLLKSNAIPSHSILVVADSLSFADKFALGIDDAGHEQLTDHINDAGSAQSHRFRTGISHNSIGGFHGVFINGAGFNGSVCGTHAAADVSALESRSRRAGAAHHKVRVTEYKLAVGSQIDEQGEFRSVPDHAHQGARGNIAAYIASDVGRDNDMRVL